ncbi:hypothetical protein PED39_03070 [Methanomassiliicoccales archaeon LGM-RCC1]|nr:hypothetical protein PED39_03070 [Methanomassiliicoccales archaeon LGM-RCC1]
MIITTYVAELINEMLSNESMINGHDYIFNTIAEVSATFVAISVAIFAIMATRPGHDIELRKFIKFDFVACSISSIITPLACMIIIDSMKHVSCSMILLMEMGSAFIMVLSIWRLINRVYYSGLQVESQQLVGEVTLIDPHCTNRSSFPNYNITSVLSKMYPGPSQHLRGRYYDYIPQDNVHWSNRTIKNNDWEFMVFLKALSEDVFSKGHSGAEETLSFVIDSGELNIDALNKVMFGYGDVTGYDDEDLSRIRKYSRQMKPKVQSPKGVYQICSAIYSRYDDVSAMEMCMTLLTGYIRYAEKHQSPSLMNRIVGRKDYISEGDSYVYTLMGDTIEAYGTMYGLRYNANHLYSKAYSLDVDNLRASSKVDLEDSRIGSLGNDYGKIHDRALLLKDMYKVLTIILMITCIMDFIGLGDDDPSYEHYSAIYSMFIMIGPVWILMNVLKLTRQLGSSIRLVSTVILAILGTYFLDLCTGSCDTILRFGPWLILTTLIIMASAYLIILDGHRVSERITLTRNNPESKWHRPLWNHKSIIIGMVVLLAETMAHFLQF